MKSKTSLKWLAGLQTCHLQEIAQLTAVHSPAAAGKAGPAAASQSKPMHAMTPRPAL